MVRKDSISESNNQAEVSDSESSLKNQDSENSDSQNHLQFIPRKEDLERRRWKKGGRLRLIEGGTLSID